jgi:hypothetical protein
MIKTEKKKDFIDFFKQNANQTLGGEITKYKTNIENIAEAIWAVEEASLEPEDALPKTKIFKI